MEVCVASAEMTAEDRDGSYSGPDRRRRMAPRRIVPVRLTRKYAEVIDGIDLSGRVVGDRVPLPPREADLLLAEGWAEPVPLAERRANVVQSGNRPRRS
jgi:hypothetical protein